jgi:hypothetical protein
VDISGATGAAPASTAADRAATPQGRGERAPSYEEIAEAAYHRFLRRGATDGHDFDDWIEAEQELRKSGAARGR